jgi:hypothetical protein
MADDGTVNPTIGHSLHIAGMIFGEVQNDLRLDLSSAGSDIFVREIIVGPSMFLSKNRLNDRQPGSIDRLFRGGVDSCPIR